MFVLNANERRRDRQPNSEGRRIHLCVDQLSAQNFRCLRLNLTKKLTELGSAKLILPLLESLSQFTCTIDYLHESKMHRSDAIYRTHYGGFLQASQCHSKQKRITGEPIKRMLLHEKISTWWTVPIDASA